MSFFSKMKPAAVEAQPQPVLPPDAPKSEPAKAADLVEGFSLVPPPRKMKIEDVPPPAPAPEVPSAPAATEPATEAPKRGRGRPPGAKNKPKEEAPTQPKDVGGLVIKSITITKGYTVNVGAFNSVRFDVSMTAEGADCYDALKAEVDAALEAEVVKYQAEVDAKNKVSVPAKEVVLK